MLLTLVSSVDDPRYNDTNTRARFTTPLAQPLRLRGPFSRACVYSVICPRDWAYADGPPAADSRFILSCDVFRSRALIGHLDHRIASPGPLNDAIFAFVPEPAQSNSQSKEYTKQFLEWHRLNPGPDLHTITVAITDSAGKDIVFNKGTVIVTLDLQQQDDEQQ